MMFFIGTGLGSMGMRIIESIMINRHYEYDARFYALRRLLGVSRIISKEKV